MPPRLQAHPISISNSAMSTAATALLTAFEVLPENEKQQLVNELFRRVPPYDSGPLDDRVVARAGDELAAMLGEEEHATQTR